MIWHAHNDRPVERIVRTGFLVSLGSYVIFWLADVLEPGFVSRYFSVHIFLLAMMVFGALWARSIEDYHQRPLIESILLLFAGGLFAVLSWNLLGDLPSYRLPLLFIAFLTPYLVASLMKSR